MSISHEQSPGPRYRHIFGPVPSRRLGRSLGVDLTPVKRCSFDCLFCQVGRTTDSSLVRGELVPYDEVMEELSDWLKRGGQADCISLAGSGEPTLNTRFGDVLTAVKRLCDIRTALLSNGSLMYMPEVRDAAVNADLVKVSLSAWDSDSFELVNRPDPGLAFSDLVDGLCKFREQYDGEMWLEVFALAGCNDSVESMKKIATIAADIGPDRIHLNTVTRPPADESARAVRREALEELAGLFTPHAEIAETGNAATGTGGGSVDASGLLSMLARRPCTSADVARGLGVGPDVAEAAIANPGGTIWNENADRVLEERVRTFPAWACRP